MTGFEGMIENGSVEFMIFSRLGSNLATICNPCLHFTYLLLPSLTHPLIHPFLISSSSLPSSPVFSCPYSSFIPHPPLPFFILCFSSFNYYRQNPPLFSFFFLISLLSRPINRSCKFASSLVMVV